MRFIRELLRMVRAIAAGATVGIIVNLILIYFF
jgi:hypothetical protein